MSHSLASARRERRLSREARKATRLEAGGWAVVHYNLACACSLRLGRETDAGVRAQLVSRATAHLSCAQRDARGPFASGRLWWLWKDPDLAPLRTEEPFQAWLRVISLGEPPPPTRSLLPRRPERRRSSTRLSLAGASS